MSENLLNSVFEKVNCQDAINYIKDCREKKSYQTALEAGKFFLNIFPNNFELISNLMYCAFDSKNYKLASHYISKLSDFDLDDKQKKILFTNLSIIMPFIKDNYTYYNLEIVKKILNKPKSHLPLITFTITTCKRYDLFEKTINSFLNCCEDIHLIDKWLLVDDNSSEEDRKKMKDNYPFFTFYFKSLEEKGHPKSMNIIRDKTTTPFIFHMEDDWQYVFKKDYISRCLEVLSYSENYGQCLINKNYGETEKDLFLIGGTPEKTTRGLRYYVHEYCKNDEEFKKFYQKHGQSINSAYWKHFSFRPSLLKKHILDSLGPFDEIVSHFESEYSNRYYNKGYVSVFLEGISNIHIGRLTSEISDKSKTNAYILNNEKQFSEKLNYNTFVLNLDRRPDRLNTFKTNVPFQNYTRFSAIDGSKLKPNDQLQRIFEGNDYFMREGMVGCALSHIQLYIDLINSESEFFLILEDDISFVPDFNEKFKYLLSILPKDWDLCYLGHHLWTHNKTDEHFDKKNNPIVYKKDKNASLQYSIGGTTGYIISKKGANLLLEFINSNGMMNCIDTMQQKAADTLNLYYCKPHLIYSDCCTNTNTDTDIQKNFRSLDMLKNGDKEKYPERLKVNNKFSITDAISNLIPNDKVFIAVSEMTHVSEALNSTSFPFDKTDGGTLELFTIYIAKALIQPAEKVANDFLQNKSNIIFPHEKDIDEKLLLTIYTKRFENLVQSIKSNKHVIIVHATRFTLSPPCSFKKLYDILYKYNKNVKILTINGLLESEILMDNSDYLIRKNLEFPEKFHNDIWYQEKTDYDQRIFRTNLDNMIKILCEKFKYKKNIGL